MHPIEQAWQEFRRKDHLCVRALDYLLGSGAASRSPLVTCQSSRLGSLILRGLSLNPPLGGRPADYLNEVNAYSFRGSVWAAYRENKRIYRFTAELTRELGKFQDSLQWPLRTLKLPHRGIALDFSAALGNAHPDAYILLTYDDTNDEAQAPSLVINVMRLNASDDHHARVCSIPATPSTSHQTLWGAMEADHRAGAEHLEAVLANLDLQYPNAPQARDLHDVWGQEIRHHRREIAAGPEGLVASCPILPAVIGALYYLQGDPEVVKSIHPGVRPLKHDRKINWTKTLHKQTLVAPTVQLIGESFSAAIQHYEIERERLKGLAQGGTKCPHLRRPHLHTYWKGPERDQLSIKFLGWIGVAGAEVPESLKEAYAPVITPVE